MPAIGLAARQIAAAECNPYPRQTSVAPGSIKMHQRLGLACQASSNGLLVEEPSAKVPALGASFNVPFQVADPQATAFVRGSPFPRFISAAGRSPDDLTTDIQSQLQQHAQALVHAVEPGTYAAMRKALEFASIQYHARAKMLICKAEGSTVSKQQKLPGTVCIVSAGPEDQPAADQLKLAAEHLGAYVISKPNISIRQLSNLMEQLPVLQAADVVIAIAGIDSSLPGVISGLVDAPVIALPTSSGSTGGLQGLGALLSSVTTPGVSVVNVDGFIAAATQAARMLRTTAVRVERMQAVTAAAAAATAAADAAATASADDITVTAEPVPGKDRPNGNGQPVTANNVVPKFDNVIVPAAQSAAAC